MIYADTAREKGLFGKGIKIAVLDSGLDTTNTDLKQANIMQGYNCIADANDVTDVSDNYGHGNECVRSYCSTKRIIRQISQVSLMKHILYL